MKKHWINVTWKIKRNNKFYESSLLQLNSSKSKKYLSWRAILSLDQTVKLTAEWYKNYYLNKELAKEITFKQIKYYTKLLNVK